MPVSPGVIVSTPAPYSASGNIAISVKWTSSQSSLEGKAKWWVEAQHNISSIGIFDTGTYVVNFGPCSVAGYTAPPAKTVSMPTPNQIVTLTVTYGHA